MTDARLKTEAGAGTAAARVEHALVVDVDGTLLRTDLLWEGMLHLAARRTRDLPGALSALLGGRASFKRYVARHAAPDLELMPVSSEVRELITEAQRRGERVYLVSGAAHEQVSALGARLAVDGAFGSEDENMTGEAKLRLVRSLCATFDYVGDSTADRPLWQGARRAYVANPRRSALRAARRVRRDIIEVGQPRQTASALLRAIRPHQWAKNALLLLPLFAAHLRWNLALALTAFTAIAAFSAGASSIYLLNDLLDLPHDRRHPRKRTRPLAAGDLGIGTAIVGAAVLAGTALALAATLPGAFALTLAAYLAFSLTYATVAKRFLGVDVIILAVLYTLRVIAGGAAAGVSLSRWFLAFSIFLFLSLAVAKRVIELRRSTARDGARLPGRGYVSDDVPVLSALGVSATVASALVYCLYIDSPDALRLYHRPDVLWVGLPVLLCWYSYFWLKVGRLEVDDDPVIFAMRDRTSIVLFAIFLVVVAVSSLGV